MIDEPEAIDREPRDVKGVVLCARAADAQSPAGQLRGAAKDATFGNFEKDGCFLKRAAFAVLSSGVPAATLDMTPEITRRELPEGRLDSQPAPLGKERKRVPERASQV